MENNETYIEKKEIKKTARACGFALLLYLGLQWVLETALFGLMLVAGKSMDKNLSFIISTFCLIGSFVMTFCVAYKKRFFSVLSGTFDKSLYNLKTGIKGVPVVLCASLLGGAVYIFILYISEQFGISYDASSLLEAEYTGAAWWVYIIYGCIIAPALEELIFRGFILGSLKEYNRTSALIISAVMFATFHGVYTQVPTAFFAGLVLGGMYLYTNSVVAPLAMHALYNTLAQLGSYCLSASSFVMQLWLVLWLLLIAVGIILFISGRKKLVFPEKNVKVLGIVFTRISVLATIIIPLLIGSEYIIR